VNQRRVFHLWRASGCNLHARRRRRRAGPPSPRPPEATKPGEFRDKCPNMEWFLIRTEARVIIESYRRQYNEERPHSRLAYRTPAEASASRLLSPTASNQEVICDPLQSAGLTLPAVQERGQIKADHVQWSYSMGSSI
jgi:Integrase core domain